MTPCSSPAAMLFALAVLFAAACGSRPSGRCGPEPLACTCADGRMGSKACAHLSQCIPSLGMTRYEAYGACVCDDAGTTRCADGESQCCTCPDGTASNQPCVADGSGFGACVCRVPCSPACGAGFICSFAGLCEVDPTSIWTVYLVRLQLPATMYSGAAWDPLPFPSVTATVGSAAAYPATFYGTRTTLDYDFTPPYGITGDQAGALRAYLDFAVHDWHGGSPPPATLIGDCTVSLGDGAFSGATQTLVCPTDAATMQSGFTLTYRLAPD